MEHYLKVWNKYYKDLVNPNPCKRKNLEVRQEVYPDKVRLFSEGDILILQETHDGTTERTGRETKRLVTYCLRGLPFVPEGYVIMSLARAVDA